MKALVTGGTGFVGSHIARMLVEQGHQVRVLHRTTSRLDALAGIDYESAVGGLLDKDALRTACEGCEWVFHVAAVADYWRADRARMFAANVDGTRCVLQAAREAGVKRVIFTSSAASVGLRAGRAASDETDSFNLPADLFPYGFSKFLAEKVVAQAVADGQDVVTLNPVVIMGPGDLNMISGSFVTQIRDLQWLTPLTRGGIAVTDVRDVARWHIAAAEKGRAGERYILSTLNTTYEQWFHMIADTVGVARPFLMLPDFMADVVAVGIDVLRWMGLPTLIDSTQARMATQYIYFDAGKAWEELGEPQFTMKQSLQETYDWYVMYGYLQSNLLAHVISQAGDLIGMERYYP